MLHCLVVPHVYHGYEYSTLYIVLLVHKSFMIVSILEFILSFWLSSLVIVGSQIFHDCDYCVSNF